MVKEGTSYKWNNKINASSVNVVPSEGGSIIDNTIWIGYTGDGHANNGIDFGEAQNQKINELTVSPWESFVYKWDKHGCTKLEDSYITGDFEWIGSNDSYEIRSLDSLKEIGSDFGGASSSQSNKQKEHSAKDVNIQENKSFSARREFDPSSEDDWAIKKIDDKKYNINFSYFKPYFDVGMGKEVTSKKEIDDYCKQNNLVYAGDAEITQQCKQNKRENEIKQKEAFRSGLEKELSKVL
jgi:hypothetical protein